jgi:Uma2 family endonuclease
MTTPTFQPASAQVDPAEYELPPEEARPNYDNLITEDGAPVDSILVERQYRLLTEPLLSSWPGPGEGRPFLILANVGLFHSDLKPPYVPDVLLSLDARIEGDPSRKENQSYYVWRHSKPPDVVIEIVSDRLGGEETHKMRGYALLRIPYYVIFDPRDPLGHGPLRGFWLGEQGYQPVDPRWLPAVGLGLVLWRGTLADIEWEWLRWCDRNGKPIPTGAEHADDEKKRADQAQERIRQLEAQLRAKGIEPQA